MMTHHCKSCFMSKQVYLEHSYSTTSVSLSICDLTRDKTHMDCVLMIKTFGICISRALHSDQCNYGAILSSKICSFGLTSKLASFYVQLLLNINQSQQDVLPTGFTE